MVALFPGQGTQFIGMSENAYNESEHCRRIMKEAEKILNIPILDLMFKGPILDLSATENCQPAILLNSFIHWIKSREDDVNHNIWMLGHSLGEYTALVASGWISLRDALLIVKKRGLCMAKEYQNGSSLGMIAVMINPSYISKIDELARKSNIEIANYNSSQLIVLSGYLSELKRTVTEWKSNGIINASKQLQVSSAFHSSFMKDPLREFSSFLDEYPFPSFREPDSAKNHQFFSSWLCKPMNFRNRNELREYLKEQFINPVYWYQSVIELSKLDNSIDKWIEFGSDVLSNLIKRDQKFAISAEKIKSLK